MEFIASEATGSDVVGLRKVDGWSRRLQFSDSKISIKMYQGVSLWIIL